MIGPASILRNPGELIVNPTDLTSPTPYGGHKVGRVRDASLVSIAADPLEIQCELLGEPSDVLEGGNYYRWVCFLRGWDDAAVENFFAGGYAAGSRSKHAVNTRPGTRIPGQSSVESGNDRSLVLLWAPEDPLHANAFIAYRAVANWTAGSERAFRRREEYGIPITFTLLRGATGSKSIYQEGRISDLVLT